MNAHQKIEKAKVEQATNLDLSEMALNTLPASIGELKELKVLNLAKNNLQSLPIEIGRLKNLQTLNLWNNSLHDLPREFGQLKNLEQLDLEDNHFTDIPSIIFKLENLKVLDLEHNIISELRPDIQQLGKLEQLDVSRNKLNQLHPAIGELKNLRSLNLKGNLLSFLPTSMCELNHLGELLVKGNGLSEELETAATEGIVAIKEYFRQKAILDLINSAKETNLFKLDLSGRGITEVPQAIFELKHLKILSLDHNEIWEIPEAIKKLTALEVLDLSHNQLVEVPKLLGTLPNLKFIETVGNPITGSGILPKVVYKSKEIRQRIQVCKSKGIHTLDLSDCGLTNIPKEVFQLKHLKSLVLGKLYKEGDSIKHRNFLSSLPEAILNLEALEHLDLTGNNLTVLPSFIGKLANLKVLVWKQNELRKLPKGLFTLSNQLRKLDLSCNQINSIPNQFGELSKLEELDLSYNNIGRLPALFGAFTQLKSLIIAYNSLKEISQNIGNLSALQYLDASYNQLKSLPNALAQLTNLQYLELSNNQLNQLPGNIHQLRFSLKDLNLSKNKLRVLPVGARHLVKLNNLDLSYNQLVDFPDAIFEMKQLKILSLHHNKLTRIPNELMELTLLEELDLVFNDFNKSLIRPVKKGLVGIKEWFNFQEAVQRIKAANAKKSEILDISDLGLRTIPRELFNLKHLKTLKLGKNYHRLDDDSQQNSITHLTKSFGKLEQLEVLIAPNNDLSEIPAEVVGLSKLRVLDVANNQIKTLPADIEKMQTLQHLNVNHNQLKTLPNEVAFMDNLQEVHWNLNPFQSPFKETLEMMDLRSVKHWLSQQLIETRIKEAIKSKADKLDLSSFNLNELPAAIFNIKTLKHLNVSNNQLENIPEEVVNLNRLESLNVDNNKLQELPKAIAKLYKLRKLECKANPLSAMPNSVCNQDVESIRQWLIQQEINETIEKLLEGTNQEAAQLYQKGIVICQVCEGKQNLNGYNPHMKIQFYQHTCYGCNGVGKIQYDSEQIHIILNNAQNNIQQVENDLRKTVQQKKNFEQSMLFSSQANSPILAKHVLKSHHNILKRYNVNLDKLSKRHQFYKDVQQRLHGVLYNQYLLYCAMDEFRKLEHLDAGLSLNFEEKAALQKNIVDEVSNLNDFVSNSNGLAIPTDFINIVGELANRYKAIL